jgi:magnesium transporter
MRDDVSNHLAQPVASVARKDATLLRADMTIESALAHIRTTGIGEKIIYFYVIDADDRLAGVVATRQLLGNPLETRLRDIMSTRVIALPDTATLLEACELFVLYKLLAFPVVDAQRRVTGVIDISFFAQEVFAMSEDGNHDDVFEAIGLRVEQLRNASPGTAFKHRFPWLLGTIGSGSVCALLAGAFETTLAHALTIAFFLPLILGLNESVGMQSMSLSLQALHAKKSGRWKMPPGIRRELLTALLLAAASAVIAGLIVWGWRQSPGAAAVVAATILTSLVISGVVGFLVPVLLRRGERDPKIAAGPTTLAIVDIIALLIYFTLAMLALG